VTRHTWGWSKPRAIGILLLFLSFDIPFLLANCLKFFDGGYLPFAVGAAFVLVMVSWRIGRSYLGDVVDAGSQPIDDFLKRIENACRTRIPGTAIVMASRSTDAPTVLVHLLNRFAVLHENVVLVTVLTEHTPTV